MRRQRFSTRFLWTVLGLSGLSVLMGPLPTAIAASSGPSAQAPATWQTAGRGDARVQPRQPPRLPQRLPETAEERRKLLSSLYGYLSEAKDAGQAQPLVASIQRLWSISGSPTTDLLMARATQALETGNLTSALKFLNAVTKIQPEYAEGWNRRAYVFYQRSAPDRALGDLRRVLALDPNHFQALESVGSILRTMGETKAALEAYRKLQVLHPQATGVGKIIDELAREVEGEPI
jgi:tetratricopeptide (TPR) repeat protein